MGTSRNALSFPMILLSYYAKSRLFLSARYNFFRPVSNNHDVRETATIFSELAASLLPMTLGIIFQPGKNQSRLRIFE